MKRRHVPLLLLVLVAVLAAPAGGQATEVIVLADPQCSDTVDNDGDGKVDLDDPDCLDASDDSEAPDPPPPPACSDTLDNDGDTKVDLEDPGCENALDDTEAPDPPPPSACSDTLDNDGDGKVDGDDPGCSGALDDTEAPDPPPVDVTDPTIGSLSITESSQFAFASGDTIYLNPAPTVGTYRVSVVASDDLSGIDKVRFPDPTAPDPRDIPCTVEPCTAARTYRTLYDFGDVPPRPGDPYRVTAFDNAGHSASVGFTVLDDATAPVDVSVQYTDGNDDNGTIEVSVTNGTDAQSGVNLGSGLLERQLGTLTDTALGPTCTNLGTWTATSPTNTITTLQCAFYRYSISDNVGNIAMDTGPAAVWFDDRDRIPPENVTNATSRAGDHFVRLTYDTPTVDFDRVKIFRTKVGDPGSKRLAFNGTATRFVDRTVFNRTRYVYEIVTYDATGNRPDPGVLKTALPKSRYLLWPRDGAIRTTPPRLSWKPKSRATFYNVKLVRNNRTVLSAFPRGETFQVRSRWKYKGVTRRFVDGNYFWYVWPRIGGRYGALMGWSRFTGA